MDQRIEQIKNVLSDKEYTLSLLQLENAEDIQASLKEKGVELSIEEIKGAYQILKKVGSGEFSEEDLKKMANGQLTDEQLEQVSGGILVTLAATISAVLAGMLGITSLAYGITGIEEIVDRHRRR